MTTINNKEPEHSFNHRSASTKTTEEAEAEAAEEQEVEFNPKYLNGRQFGRGTRFNVWSSNSLRRSKTRFERRTTEETITKINLYHRNHRVQHGRGVAMRGDSVGDGTDSDADSDDLREASLKKGVVDDGEMISYCSYSLGRRKRWLIVDELKQRYEEVSKSNKNTCHGKSKEENKSGHDDNHEKSHCGDDAKTKTNRKGKRRTNKIHSNAATVALPLIEELNHGRANRRIGSRAVQQHEILMHCADKRNDNNESVDSKMQQQSTKKKKKTRRERNEQLERRRQHVRTVDDTVDRPLSSSLLNDTDFSYYRISQPPKVNDKRMHDQDDHGYWSPDYVFGPRKKNYSKKMRSLARMPTVILDVDAKGSILSKNKLY